MYETYSIVVIFVLFWFVLAAIAWFLTYAFIESRSNEWKQYLLYKQIVGDLILIDNQQAVLLDVTRDPPPAFKRVYRREFWICYLKDEKYVWKSSTQARLLINGVEH